VTQNPFDLALLGFTVVAVVTGFSAGLLRSLATILAYVIAAPVAVAVSPAVTAWAVQQNLLSPDKSVFVALGLVLVVGMLLGALMRGAVGSATGGHTVFIDRVLGALLGGVRIALLAIVLVLVFERIIPSGQEPEWIAQSQARPYLSAAGAAGLRALPPQVIDYIDKLKKERGL
jgi:membrane protein required for colicin V production